MAEKLGDKIKNIMRFWVIRSDQSLSFIIIKYPTKGNFPLLECTKYASVFIPIIKYT